MTSLGSAADGAGLVVQFGTGVFLRGFIDSFVQRSRDAGLWSGAVLGVKLTPGGGADFALAQRAAYSLRVQGMEKGVRVEDEGEIDVVSRWINPHTDEGFDALLHSAKAPRVDLIVSNSTEAGIVYAHTEQPTAACPATYPAKLTAWLAARHVALAAAEPAAADQTLTVLPLELIEDAGPRLREIVLRHAEDWALGAGFAEWLARSVVFRSALVDRIVTKPAAQDDPLLVIAEPYHLLVVEAEGKAKAEGEGEAKGEAVGGGGAAKKQRTEETSAEAGSGGGALERRLRLREAGVNVIYTPELPRWRTRKVRVLNGAHHSIVFLGLRLGLGNVRSCVQHPALRPFLDGVLTREVLPALEGEPDELRACVGGRLECETASGDVD